MTSAIDFTKNMKRDRTLKLSMLLHHVYQRAYTIDHTHRKLECIFTTSWYY